MEAPLRVGVVMASSDERMAPYLARLAAAGAEVEKLPWTGDPARDAARFDALVLCGGDDVDARHFGEANHPSVTVVPGARDEYEIRIVRHAAELDVPVLGVCRGSQVMNVAMGGTLVQHVPELPGAGAHGDGAKHEVALAEGTKLRGIAGPRRAVNSFHHQAVGRLGTGMRAAARSADGVVEAVEGPGAFFVGVQWHPEREGNDEPLGAGLFEALLEAARARRAASAR